MMRERSDALKQQASVLGYRRKVGCRRGGLARGRVLGLCPFQAVRPTEMAKLQPREPPARLQYGTF